MYSILCKDFLRYWVESVRNDDKGNLKIIYKKDINKVDTSTSTEKINNNSQSNSIYTWRCIFSGEVQKLLKMIVSI